MDNFIQTATYEHSFWLQVLRDHSQFILDGLAEKEKEEIQQAKAFKHAFQELLNRLNTGSNIAEITKDAEEMTVALRNFKLSLLQKQLTLEITKNES
ncbi:DUF2935 domain-containing protein [Gottfriedia solisilvae]|uniref:DUF2935 domain-containing protein n=1 Tax=Gottfriedia solisilvae TaxID=1516104 RepID=UPI003D2EF6F6